MIWPYDITTITMILNATIYLKQSFFKNVHRKILTQLLIFEIKSTIRFVVQLWPDFMFYSFMYDFDIDSPLFVEEVLLHWFYLTKMDTIHKKIKQTKPIAININSKMLHRADQEAHQMQTYQKHTYICQYVIVYCLCPMSILQYSIHTRGWSNSG